MSDIGGLQKRGFIMQISRKMYEDMVNPRKPKSKTRVEPTTEEVMAFREWKARMEELRAIGEKNSWFSDGSDFDTFTYNEPVAHWEYEF